MIPGFSKVTRPPTTEISGLTWYDEVSLFRILPSYRVTFAFAPLTYIPPPLIKALFAFISGLFVAAASMLDSVPTVTFKLATELVPISTQTPPPYWSAELDVMLPFVRFTVISLDDVLEAGAT